MSKIIGFNYPSIKDPRVRKQARENADAIRDMVAATGRYMVEIGKRLIATKAVLSPEQFRAWWESEFGFHDRTCYRYMRAAEKFGDIQGIENIQSSALLRLSCNNVPEDLVNEAIARAQAGELVTDTQTLNAIQAANVPRGNGGGRRQTVTIRFKDSETLGRSLNVLEEEIRRRAPSMGRDECEGLADRLLQLIMDLRRNTPLEHGDLQPVA